MIGMRLEQAKQNFFDRKAITDPAEKATRRVLSAVGAYTMRDAQKSLKEGTGISAPGQPPLVHLFALKTKTNKKGKAVSKRRSPFRDSILFVYDSTYQGVLVGPILFNGARNDPTVPQLLEAGGNVTVGKKSLRYQPRPFMKPAFDKNLKKLPQLWANSIR